MDIGLAVGGAFLSSALNVLSDRLVPKNYLLKMFQKHEDHVRLLKKLEDILLVLKIVLSDAQNKQASNSYVSQWLNKLQCAVDGAENLIEQINYEALRLKVEGQHQNLAETSNQQVSGDFFINIKEKLKHTIETLEALENQTGRLGLEKHFDSGKQESRSPSTSLVGDIFGRQNEIGELIDRLLSEDANGENLSVVPIVGMGGVGKTTLAKAVYNDEKVKDHFDLKAWFCVSESCDAFRITKGLLQEIGSFDSKDDDNFNQLQVKLKERLQGKKFLVVLDDVWTCNYIEWDDMMNIFVKGDIGSKIIVTTRNHSVASRMGRGEINVGTLSSEASWDLFKRHSLEKRDPEDHPELVEVGKQIAQKCKGLPLALKALAGILRGKSEVYEWRDILRSEIWELPSSIGILPALMLSYNDLPAELKQCFAYCAIYPKGYPFRKEQVIHLWISNGLVHQLHSGNQYSTGLVHQLHLGNQYFLELRSRSLFEWFPESSKRYVEEFLMHDLVNDLAQIASSKLCIRLEENKRSHMLEQSRHMSYSMSHGDFVKLEPFYNSEQLRTLLPINLRRSYSCTLSKRVLHNILPSLTSLRALSLSGYDIVELPNYLFIKLKLLKFLDLSRTKIKKLPASICVLYNLEILLLSYCENLEELPPQMEKLINLHHLDITGTSHLKMPLQPSKLKSLHVLVGAEFLLGGRGGSRMEDLGELHNLYGSLSILKLQNVVDRREALKAKMGKKENVKKLSLEWSESIADNSQTERDILDGLHPHSNIEELQITGYRGTKFPNWLADHSFDKLVKLFLSNCNDCDSLPALGQLPSLKFLAIGRMYRITEVTEEFYGSSSPKKPFNSLETLEFGEMLEWKQWHVLGNGEFPKLQKLSIRYCPKLMGKLPENLCSLTELRISRCPELNLETPIQLSSLIIFEVDGSPKVGVLFDEAELFTSQLQGMKQIDELHITDCNSLTSLPISTLPSTLKSIWIRNCRKLKLERPVGEMISSMFVDRLELIDRDYISPELVPRPLYLEVTGLHSLTTVLIPTATEDLSIHTCENLQTLSVACGTQMTSLSIYKCEKLKWLPERMQELLPSLKELRLYRCPEIESFPEGGLPFSLEVLEITYCEKLVNGRKEWSLQRLPCLTELWIEHNSSDEEILADENWQLPCSIRRLAIFNLKTLSSQFLKSLTSLEYLRIGNLPQIQSLLEEGLPSSLSELHLYEHDELHSLPTEGLRNLTSLRSLYINVCDQLQSLAESALPSSLSKLTIYKCPNLQSLAESALPSSLSKLTIHDCLNFQSIAKSALASSLSELSIYNCPNLQSLPVKGIPSSISNLNIYDCPLLKPLLEFEEGEYWSKIAHISEIRIDFECL